MLVPIPDPVAVSIYRYGAYDVEDHGVLAASSEARGSRGRCRGARRLLHCRWQAFSPGATGEVAAFEPERVRSSLAPAKSGVLANVAVVGKAVGASAGHAELRVPAFADSAFATVAADDGPDPFDAVGPSPCERTSLDAYAAETGFSPALVKLDVENEEESVLDGMRGGRGAEVDRRSSWSSGTRRSCTRPKSQDSFLGAGTTPPLGALAQAPDRPRWTWRRGGIRLPDAFGYSSAARCARPRHLPVLVGEVVRRQIVPGTSTSLARLPSDGCPAASRCRTGRPRRTRRFPVLLRERPLATGSARTLRVPLSRGRPSAASGRSKRSVTSVVATCSAGGPPGVQQSRTQDRFGPRWLRRECRTLLHETFEFRPARSFTPLMARHVLPERPRRSDRPQQHELLLTWRPQRPAG